MIEDQQEFSERRLFIGIVMAMVLALAFVTPGDLKADETSEQIQGIVIEEAVATPGKVGGDSSLKFKITNLSANSVKLMQVHTAASNDVRLEMADTEVGRADNTEFDFQETELGDKA